MKRNMIRLTLGLAAACAALLVMGSQAQAGLFGNGSCGSWGGWGHRGGGHRWGGGCCETKCEEAAPCEEAPKCECVTTCCGCDDGCGGRRHGRLFRRNRGCGCDCGCNGTAPATEAAPAEAAPAAPAEAAPAAPGA